MATAPTAALAAENAVLKALNARPSAQNERGVDGYLPDGRTVEVKFFAGSGRPSIGSMLDGESREDAVKRLLVADIYAAVTKVGVFYMSHDEMLAFALNASGITRKASKRGGGLKVRFSRGPSR
jgi:hypothetical protein